MHDQPIEFGLYLDLAREAAIGFPLGKGAAQHFFLVFGNRQRAIGKAFTNDGKATKAFLYKIAIKHFAGVSR